MRNILGIIFSILGFAALAFGQATVTPNLQLQIPSYQQTNWQVPLNYDMSALDAILAGQAALPTGATPAISQQANWITANTGATAITNFVGGLPGQTIRILCGSGDTFTSIANSVNISVSSTWACATSKNISFVLNGTVWTEFARSGGGAGSAVLWQNQGTGIGTPATINCFTNVTCSYSAGVVTIVANLTGGTVSTSGSPAAANLTCFTAAAVVSNCDLSGDVTTSGSAASTVTRLRNITLPSLSGATGLLYDASGTLTLPGVLPGVAFPALTGDITTTAGSLATTLAAVNSNVGSFTLASITVDAKGRIIAAANGTGGSGLPGGSPLQVQVNNAPNFGGTPCQVYPTVLAITVGPIQNTCDSEFTFNPYTDARLYGMRSTANAMPTTPGMTGTITAGSNSLTVSTSNCPGQTSSVCFVNGDSVLVLGAGANQTMGAPGTPVVLPSISRVMTGTGDSVPSPSGSITVNYIVVAEDIGEGFSPASVAGSTTTALTLGSTAGTISSISRANGVVTVNFTTSQNLSVGSMVEIAGVADLTFNGQYQVATAPSGTQFTFTQALDTRNGASLSSTGGTVYYFPNNLVSWTQGTGPTPYRYFICSDRATPGTFHIVGMSKPNNPGNPSVTDGTLYWEDFGATMRGGLIIPPNASDAICTGTGTPDALITKIVSGAGSTVLILANNAGNTVSSSPVRFDNGLNFKTALTNLGALPLYIPQGNFVINSIVDAHTLGQASIVGGFLTINDTIILENPAWKGSPFPYTASASSFQFESYPSIFCSANPCIHFTNGGSGRFEGISLAMAGNNNIGILSDGGGGGPGATYDRVNIGLGNNPYMSEAIEFRGASDGSGSGACHNMKEVLLLGAQFSVGQTATPIYYGNRGGCLTHDSLFLNGGGVLLRYDSPGGSITSRFGYRQGGYEPVWTITGIKENGGLTGANFSTDQFFQDTDPSCLVSYLPSNSSLGGAIRIKTGSEPVLVNQVCGNPYGYQIDNGVASQTGVNVGANALFASGAPILVTGATSGSEIGMQMQHPTAPTATLDGGGSIPLNTYYYQIVPIDFLGNYGPISAVSNGIAVSGSQQVLLSWTPVPGQFSTYVCRGTSPTNIPCAGAGGGISAPGSSWVDNTPQYDYSNSQPTSANALAVGATATGLIGPQIMLNAGGFSATISGIFTTNRTQLVPDAAGTFLLSGNGDGTHSIKNQELRVAGCATAGTLNATCDTTVTWTTPFADANYTVTCDGSVVTSGIPIVEGLNISTPQTAAAVTVRTLAVTASAAQFTTVGCVAIHD